MSGRRRHPGFPGRATFRSSSRLKDHIRRYTDPLYSGAGLDKDLKQALKLESLEVQLQVLRKVPLGLTRLIGSPFPRALRQIKQPAAIIDEPDLADEIGWTGAALLATDGHIVQWLTRRRQFERAFMFGDWTKADQELRAAVSEQGHSLWSVEATLLLQQEISGLESNRFAVQELRQESGRWLGFWLHFFSHRVESDLSHEDFSASVNEILDGLAGVPERNGLRYTLITRALSQDLLEDEAWAVLFAFEDTYPLVDRLCLLERFFRSPQFRLPGRDSKVDETLAALAQHFTDAHFSHSHALATLSFADNASVSAPMMGCLHSYARGDYERSLVESTMLLRDAPWTLEPYEIAVKSLINAGWELNRIPINACPAARLLRHMRTILERGSEFAMSLDSLRGEALRLDSIPLGPQLASFANAHAIDTIPLRVSADVGRRSCFITPRSATVQPTVARSHELVCRLAEGFPENAAVQVFLSDYRALASNVAPTPPDGIPLSRASRHIAVVLERQGKWQEALERYDALLRDTQLSAADRADARAGSYRCRLALRDMAMAARSVAEATAHQPFSVGADTLKSLVTYYEEEVFGPLMPGDIAWPIVATASQLCGATPTDPSFVHDVLDDFRRAHELARPALALSMSDRFDQRELIYFARYACSTEVLEEATWYSSQDEMESERISILQWLQVADPDNTKVYDEEIAELSRNGAVRHLAATAERSRIFVDTTAILQRLPQVTRERLARALQLRRLQELLRKTIDSTAEANDDLNELKNLVFVDEGLELFTAVFNEVREQFLWSAQFGLDANLSQRVRHGVLEGEVRSLFEAGDLLTPTDQHGTFVPNLVWSERLDSLTPHESAQVLSHLDALSASVDSLIAEVNSKWIRIADDKSPEGLFTYSFADDDISTLYEAAADAHSVDGALLSISDALWTRTSDVLQKVRDAIDTTLRSRILAILADAEAAILGGVRQADVLSLLSELSHCQSRVDNAMGAISEWFRIDEQQNMRACHLSELVAALLPIVKRNRHAPHVSCYIEQGGTLTIEGAAFRPMWDLLYNVVVNAIKHSLLDDPNIHISVEQSAGMCTFSITNELSDRVDRSALADTIKSINDLAKSTDALLRVNLEGKSGYYKLHKILGWDLRAQQYTVKAAVENNRFVVLIAVEDTCLLA